MLSNERPGAQGLYRPEYEHDNCGMGFIAHMDGVPSRGIVEDGITILERLMHRGGTGAEEDTGDGAGILMAMPDKFMRAVCGDSGVELPPLGSYAVAMLFLPRGERQDRLMERTRSIISESGFDLLHVRRVPYSFFDAGPAARNCSPEFFQLFITGDGDFKVEGGFEHKLYVLRRTLEQKIRFAGDSDYYIASLSARTIVYKGMLHAWQLKKYFPDLADERMESSICVVHSRFSTNTFPSWDRAQPCRFIAHNGEINTLRGNENWFRAKESVNDGGVFKNVRDAVIPVIDVEGSDSIKFDNCLEFLCMQGRPLPQVLLMMIPEAWSKAIDISPQMKSFYEYSATIMEPWDGPAAICFSDGRFAGAILDRNGLRPARYMVTSDRRVVLASEAGVIETPASQIVKKGRLGPGEMVLVDTQKGELMLDHQVKEDYAGRFPYSKWLGEFRKTQKDLPVAGQQEAPLAGERLGEALKAFGYNYEGIKNIVVPMAQDGHEPITAMGMDVPVAVLSENPQPLYDYFKQLFAQVTNPPIDALREEIVTGTEVFLGASGDFTKDIDRNCRKLRLESPVLDDKTFAGLKALSEPGFKTATVPMLYDVSGGGAALESALEELFSAAEREISAGATVIVLSDRGFSEKRAGIPALLAGAGLHHHLIRRGLRGRADIVIDTAEAYEVHHFAALVGYGVSAIHPYCAYSLVKDLVGRGYLEGVGRDKAVGNYIKAVVDGIVKIMSKMGISAVAGYQGAQVFEALGVHPEVVDKYFTGTASRIGGIKLTHIADETAMRHAAGFGRRSRDTLKSGGVFQYKRDGEFHLYNPEAIHTLQQAVRTGDYSLYKKYTGLIDDKSGSVTLRSLLEFNYKQNPIPVDMVEPVERIVTRFKTGAMSYGSISEEAHRCLAVAMNRLHGKSNSGEGGEDPSRLSPMDNGDTACSAIKQVASGRFGVTAQYLASAKEIQIKMAQGAKPGEGGHLPGHKVYPWIARVRNSIPGVGLISPPPHHDIYSIEDLAQLIYDLKNSNPSARINVKLVSEVGVGTIAAGVAKGKADVILVSGYDGGTGAAPRTSIQHAGLPWEMGVAETHRTLAMNGLRDRILLETDGKMMSGRDVAIAAMLGAEEYGFATLPLVSMGCVMMRVCNLNTCPVGIATQNPDLRKFFAGKPEYVENCLLFIATELREIMAQLGVSTVEELIGRTDLLKQKKPDNKKTEFLDLSPLISEVVPIGKKHMAPLAGASEWEHFFAAVKALVEAGQSVTIEMPIGNTERSTGTRLGGWLARRYGDSSLPDNLVHYKFKGTAGQSLGAFVPKGITLEVEGDANDHVAKGLCGGRVIIYPPKDALYSPGDNTIIGNVACYGATGGEVYVRGLAGERFCVRNSGASAVVEGIGDHGCEYMTGGVAVILGPTGYNFAAGMSGGVAYAYDVSGDFKEHCNLGMVALEPLENKDEEILRDLLWKHYKYTGSSAAQSVLDSWETEKTKFIKVMPMDYEQMLREIDGARGEGLEGAAVLERAFERKLAAGNSH